MTLGSGIVGILFLIFCIFLAFFVYFLPSFVAYKRRALSRGGIVALNALLGWTLLGWVGALIWSLSCKTEHDQRRESDQQAQMLQLMALQTQAALNNQNVPSRVDPRSTL